MKGNIISFELAKLLASKEFDEVCEDVYIIVPEYYGTLDKLSNVHWMFKSANNTLLKEFARNILITAPEIEVAREWIKTNKTLSVDESLSLLNLL